MTGVAESIWMGLMVTLLLVIFIAFPLLLFLSFLGFVKKGLQWFAE